MSMSDSHQLPRILGKFKKAFLSVGIFSVFFNLLVLTLPLYMLSIFTRVFSSKSDETLLMLTVAATIALVFQAALDVIRSRVLVRVGMGLDTSLTPQVLEAVVRESAGAGKRNTQSLRDASELRTFLTGNGVFTIFDAPFAPLYVMVIYLLHPVLGMVALVGAVLLFGLALVNDVATRKPIRQAAFFTSQSHQRVDEFVRNADAIESMGMLPEVIERWRGHNGDALHAISRAADTSATTGALAKFIRTMLQIGLFGGGAYLYILGELLPGSIIAASLLMGRALAPVEQAISTWRQMMSAKLAYRRLGEVLKPERFSLYRDRMSLPRPSGRIDVERVVVMAPGTDRLILRGVGFNIRAGEFLGIIGPSGAGKSTLAKVLVGVLPIKGGNARLDGSELSAWHPDDLGQYIGYVPQDIQLFPGTVKENIARMARDPDPDEVIEAARFAGVHDTIVNLPEGYDTDIGDAGSMLSAGQRQHVALARAFFGNPSVLVLDEPNSNLDSVSEAALVRALATAKERGMTIIVITHRPTILNGADKLLLLREGSVELFGPRDKVMERMQQQALGQQQRAQIAVVKEPAEADEPGPQADKSSQRGERRPETPQAASSDGESRREGGSQANRLRTGTNRSKSSRKAPTKTATMNQQTPNEAKPPPSKQPEPQAEERLVETTIVRADNTIVRADKAIVRSKRK